MTKRMTAKEIAGVLGVVLVLVGLPLLLWAWQTGTLENPYPPGTRIITLTAIADGGIWTKEEVVGHNYWRRKPTRVSEIEIS